MSAPHFPDACACGLTPQVKEIKTVTYVAICPCGNHGPPMQIREWAITEWNAQASGSDRVVMQGTNLAGERINAFKIP